MKNSKRAKMWRHIRDHGSISNWEGFVYYHYMRTSAWIAFLKSKGIDVRAEDEYNNGTKYTRYYIAPEEVKKAEENNWVKY